MKLRQAADVKTSDEARSLAIDWQAWASKANLSYSELAEWQALFISLALKYELEEEFKENGII